MKRLVVYVVIAFLAGTLFGTLAFGDLGDGLREPNAISGESAPAEHASVFTTGRVEGNPVAESGDRSRVTPGVDSQAEQIRLVRDEIDAMQARIESLEIQLADLRAASPHAREGSPDPGSDENRSSESGESSLSVAGLTGIGVSPDTASEIVRRQGELEMKRLELRDRAAREDYLGSEQFFDEMRELNADTPDLRREIGDSGYDRYLYSTGQDNRVAVSSVITGSPAEQVGVQPGDVILSYDGSRIFDFSELQGATRSGERDTPVSIEIRRGSESIAVSLPRGPMGVRLDTTREDPRN
ncbi:MAG: PDZ domain-containing protein [Pseudomonadota bacterium]|nr:PDZ domain-containing protein [Pseudomonadota bacterium]